MPQPDVSSPNRSRSFIREWLGSRDRELFLAGLPSAVCFLGLVGILGVTYLRSPHDLAETYHREGRDAYEAGEVEKASLYYQKSLNARSDVKQVLQEAVAVADGLGDTYRRDALLGRLSREFDDPTAYLTRADILLRARPVKTSVLEDAEVLLDQALASTNRDQSAEWQESLLKVRRRLALINRSLGRLDRARAHLESIDPPTAGDLLELAAVVRQAGDRRRAQSLTDQVLASFQGQSKPLTLSAFLAKARGLALRGESSESTRLLEQALRGLSAEAQLPLWADSAVWSFRELWRENRDAPPLAILERLLSAAPTHPGLAVLLIELALADNGEAGLPLATLESALGSGEALVTAHFLIGLQGLGSGEEQTLSEADSLHFKLASDMSPASMLALSRCALAMLEKDPLMKNEAVTTSEVALELSGSHRYCVEIHSLLLEASSKWEELVALLTPEADKHSPRLRELLATAHEKLGNRTLAKRYRQENRLDN